MNQDKLARGWLGVMAVVVVFSAIYVLGSAITGGNLSLITSALILCVVVGVTVGKRWLPKILGMESMVVDEVV